MAFSGLSCLLWALYLSGELLHLFSANVGGLDGASPSRWYWRVWFLGRLREVGYLCRLAGLASLRDWRGSCLCSELIPSVTERSVLFVKEQSFRQMAPN